MSGNKYVVLARPHPFIAEHMKKILTEQGYTPVPIQQVTELEELAAQGTVVGAVISTSITSVSGESYVDDFRHLRDMYPDLRVMFATLAKPEDLLQPIARAISSDTLNANVLEINSANQQHPSIGARDTFLLLHEDCVAKPESIRMTAAMVGRHFGNIT